jgi:hypothetical protein
MATSLCGFTLFRVNPRNLIGCFNIIAKYRRGEEYVE